jgi:phosphoribosylaminoimidazole-succinocarboxamide synthase
LPEEIPGKGRVLTQLSAFWFAKLSEIVDNHLLSLNVDDFPDVGLPKNYLEGRSMLARKAKPILVECVVRGYLAGSAWQQYRQTGGVSGVELPKGLGQSEKLPQPIFTPASKSTTGHDENISYRQLEEEHGSRLASKLKELSLRIYKVAAQYCYQRGVILADSKFEFGYVGTKIMLIDEVVTPDSSRFWPLDNYRPGYPQPSLDKQFVRDYLSNISWNKQPPVPHLPPEVVKKTSEKYHEIFSRLTGKSLGKKE